MTAHLVRYGPQRPAGEVEAGFTGLTDYDVLPRALNPALDGATYVEIDDPLSFPFDDVGPAFWETPLLIRLPDIAFEDCVYLFDRLLFRRLTVCDQLAAPDVLAAPLRRRYGFGRSMFVPPDHQPDLEALETASQVAEELWRRRSTLYTEWPLPTLAYKSRLVQVDRAVRRAVDEVRVIGGGRPTIELHGWHVRRLIPAAWGDLVRIVERRPISTERIRLDYEASSFTLCAPGTPVAPLASSVAIGVDHLRQSSGRAIERGLALMFRSVQVGGRLVLVETFDSTWRPDDFVDVLLEVSTHRLVLQDMWIAACDGDEAPTTAVFVVTKIGNQVRT